MYNYLAGLKLQTFDKLFVEEQCVNNSCIEITRVQKNPNFYAVGIDSLFYNDFAFSVDF